MESKIDFSELTVHEKVLLLIELAGDIKKNTTDQTTFIILIKKDQNMIESIVCGSHSDQIGMIAVATAKSSIAKTLIPGVIAGIELRKEYK